jgi:hypothetical protein
MRDEAKADVFDYIEGPGGTLPLALHPFPKHERLAEILVPANARLVRGATWA